MTCRHCEKKIVGNPFVLGYHVEGPDGEKDFECDMSNHGYHEPDHGEE